MRGPAGVRGLPGLGRERHSTGRLPGTDRSGQRLVQILLGLVWLADGALQCQPAMFGRGFVTSVLLPSANGNPGPVAGSISTMARLLEPHIAVWNALFAAVQVAIGIGLLVRRTVRPALAVSFVWSLAVWWFAEGLGGLLTGAASPLTGAPGAVLWYVFVGLLAWPAHEVPAGTGAAVGPNSGLLGNVTSRVAWAVFWVGGAALLCQPANLAGGALHQALVSAEAGQPGWYAGVLALAAGAVGSHGTGLTLAVAAEMALVGLGVLLGWKVSNLVGIAVVLGLLIWVFPEGLGGVLTGRGTDPNTGPLLMLAGLAWYRSRPEPRLLGRVLPPAVAQVT